MSDVTDGDRDKAAELMDAWDLDDGASYLDLERIIAAALAEERARARAPFARLADEMEHHDAELCSAMAARKRLEFDLASEAAYAMQAADLRMDARRIRRAAEESE